MRSFASSCYLFSCMLLFSGCSRDESRTIHRGFYYWKSEFHLDTGERKALDSLKTERLYLKFFDVEWNEEKNRALPVAITRFTEPAPRHIKIVPVVFITNETLQKISKRGADSLAINIESLLSSLSGKQKSDMAGEAQIDCDWNAGTKELYFQLLVKLKSLRFFKQNQLSVTIRLHQLKYVNSNGIPPADKGLLMCYNMGNLKNPGTINSIIEPGVLKAYIRKVSSYSLPLDVALPIFDWWTWFRGNNFKGLLYANEFDPAGATNNKYFFKRDTVINGRYLAKGDWLRYENSPFSSIVTISKLLDQKIKNKEVTVILYHLDSKNLSNYTFHELETIYRSFH